MTHAPDDPRETRIRELEAAIDEIAHQARLARMALCENELMIRLENIGRCAEAVRRRPAEEAGGDEAGA